MNSLVKEVRNRNFFERRKEKKINKNYNKTERYSSLKDVKQP